MSRTLATLFVPVCLLLLPGGAAVAQTAAEPYNVVHIDASAEREVLQDWLTAVLVARAQAGDATTVQNQLKTVLEGALQQARAQARSGGLEVRTGGFSVYPRHGRDGQIAGWQGQAELFLEGQDVAQVAALAGRLQGMTVSQMRFSLSPRAASQVEAEVRQEAIARFRSTAQDVARAFGLSAYDLREVTVGGAPDAPVLRRVMSAEVGAAATSAPVPVEPGKATVRITVSGTIRLR
jgi:predicted secreted protein